MNTLSPRLNKEQYEQHSKRLKDEIEMYGKLMRQKIGSPKEVQYLALRQKAALNTLRTLNEKYFTGGYNRMQNPLGLQVVIPPVNEEALLQEPAENNGMSVNSQATIVNRGMNNMNAENGLSVYDGEDVGMEGGRKRKHSRKAMKKTRKAMKKTRKAKKMVRKAKKHTRKSTKKGRKGTNKTRRCWSRK
jgi:hypothetical protein